MKKPLICLLLFISVVSHNAIYGQTISMPIDSIESLLCKKWEVGYVLIGDMKAEPKPGANTLDYEFRKDRTVLLTASNTGEGKKGTWNYDGSKKLITVTVDKQTRTRIISLLQGELVMLVDTKDATPDDPAPIKMVYKIKK